MQPLWVYVDTCMYILYIEIYWFSLWSMCSSYTVCEICFTHISIWYTICDMYAINTYCMQEMTHVYSKYKVMYCIRVQYMMVCLSVYENVSMQNRDIQSKGCDVYSIPIDVHEQYVIYGISCTRIIYVYVIYVNTCLCFVSIFNFIQYLHITTYIIYGILYPRCTYARVPYGTGCMRQTG